MSEFPQWRRKVQTIRSRPTIDDPEQNLQFTCRGSIYKSEHTQIRDTTDRPQPRPKSRFASYLNAHHTIEKPSSSETPAQDWSMPNDKDKVYFPEIELMCNTIKKQMMASLSKELPAQYNSVLLHILEAYHLSGLENQTLRGRLVASEEAHKLDVEKFRVAYIEWDKEREDYQHRLSNMKGRESNRDFDENLPEARLIDDIECADPVTGGQSGLTNAYMCADNIENPFFGQRDERPKWMRSLPSSSSPRMARLSKYILAIDTDQELPLPIPPIGSSPYGPETDGNGCLLNISRRPSFSSTRCAAKIAECDPFSIKGDLLPDEEEYKYQNIVSKTMVSSDHDHRRAFSFMPGDDAKTSTIRNLCHTRVITNDPWEAKELSRLLMVSQGQLEDLCGSGSATEQILREPVGATDQADATSTTMINNASTGLSPQRWNSARSVLTAIKSSSTEASLTSRRSLENEITLSSKSRSSKSQNKDLIAILAARLTDSEASVD